MADASELPTTVTVAQVNYSAVADGEVRERGLSASAQVLSCADEGEGGCGRRRDLSRLRVRSSILFKGFKTSDRDSFAKDLMLCMLVVTIKIHRSL